MLKSKTLQNSEYVLERAKSIDSKLAKFKSNLSVVREVIEGMLVANNNNQNAKSRKSS